MWYASSFLIQKMEYHYTDLPNKLVSIVEGDSIDVMITWESGMDKAKAVGIG